jgi:hypothetical protein
VDGHKDVLGLWAGAGEGAKFWMSVLVDLKNLYELAAYAGLRRAELCGLRWDDIDPDGTGLRVRADHRGGDPYPGITGARQVPCLRTGARRSAVQESEVTEGTSVGAARATRSGSARPASRGTA